MNDLIERLENATGPDRELDLAIEKICWGNLARRWSKVPYCTASIDAALTLVPDGWAFANLESVFEDLGSFPRAPSGVFVALLWPLKDASATPGKGEHNKPAIALCIAALRARLADSERAAEAEGE